MSTWTVEGWFRLTNSAWVDRAIVASSPCALVIHSMIVRVVVATVL
jgi:hypothetical protein